MLEFSAGCWAPLGLWSCSKLAFARLHWASKIFSTSTTFGMGKSTFPVSDFSFVVSEASHCSYLLLPMGGFVTRQSLPLTTQNTLSLARFSMMSSLIVHGYV